MTLMFDLGVVLSGEIGCQSLYRVIGLIGNKTVLSLSPGFKEAIRTHFRLQKEAVLKQCAEWLTQCTDAEEERRMRKAVDTLKSELDKLQRKEEGKTGEFKC